MNKEQVALAVNAGLELLGPNSDLPIPAKLNDGVFFLRQFLSNVGQGRLAIVPATQKADQPPAPPADPPADPPAPNRKQRRTAASKKRAKKTS